jgi:hypothetical protein
VRLRLRFGTVTDGRSRALQFVLVHGHGHFLFLFDTLARRRGRAERARPNNGEQAVRD